MLTELLRLPKRQGTSCNQVGQKEKKRKESERSLRPVGGKALHPGASPHPWERPLDGRRSCKGEPSSQEDRAQQPPVLPRSGTFLGQCRAQLRYRHMRLQRSDPGRKNAVGCTEEPEQTRLPCTKGVPGRSLAPQRQGAVMRGVRRGVGPPSGLLSCARSCDTRTPATGAL